MTATTMRWLILPDIHDKLRRANQIIEREPHDRLLLMGDFFDDFRTGVTEAADTANQVKQWLNSPNTTCLLGNHDMSYGWGRQNRRLLCPGYDAAKWIAINATMTNRDWQKFKLHAWLEGDQGAWLVSHAGVHPVWLEGVEPGKYREFILSEAIHERRRGKTLNPLRANGGQPKVIHMSA
jgi:predicted MPP superfamily phosphohydrolase